MANEVVNEQIINSIETGQQATLTGDIIRHSGAGKAYQSVSQTVAMTIQDSADQLRNMGTISTTATGVAMSQLLSTGKVTEYEAIFKQVQDTLTSSADNFKSVSQTASQILNNFSVGDKQHMGE